MSDQPPIDDQDIDHEADDPDHEPQPLSEDEE